MEVRELRVAFLDTRECVVIHALRSGYMKVDDKGPIDAVVLHILGDFEKARKFRARTPDMPMVLLVSTIEMVGKRTCTEFAPAAILVGLANEHRIISAVYAAVPDSISP